MGYVIVGIVIALIYTLLVLPSKTREISEELEQSKRAFEIHEMESQKLQRKIEHLEHLNMAVRVELEETISEKEAALTTLKTYENHLLESEQLIDTYKRDLHNIQKKYTTLEHFCDSEQTTHLSLEQKYMNLLAVLDKVNREKENALDYLQRHEENLTHLLSSQKEAIPWLAGMMADYLTYDIEILAKKLDWGHNVERAKKVAHIREIRADAQRRIEEAKVAIYQLEYLKSLYPALEDVLAEEYTSLEFKGDIPTSDPIRKYLDYEEWYKLSPTERNQLALDRYIESRKKSKWQIGRDYELSVAYEYMKRGYRVDTHGSYMGLADLGRDLIAIRDDTILLIQCKYWSPEKTIHEKHIFQLFGSLVAYCIENSISRENVKGLFITSTKLSETAKIVAKYLDIYVVENHKLVDFPRIKCNIGKDKSGVPTYIYHLPMDEQYDTTKIEREGEFYAYTVAEAEAKGFRRAYKFFHTN